jgi:NadR type nicotinamide-nucleotide adenylyltransferase
MRRYAITGPESSGKTTLSQLLAEEFNGEWIPEFAREFLLERKGIYTQKDLDLIAEGQKQLWENVSNHSLVFCDTEMIVMKVWSEFKFGSCSEKIQDFVKEQQFEHYFLCRPDIVWEEDPLREHPEQRDELFEWYLRELKNYNLPFTIVEGSIIERLKICSELINS